MNFEGEAMVLKYRHWLLAAALVVAGLGLGGARAADHGVDVPMDADPPVTDVARPAAFDPRLKGLWVEALGRPEANLRMSALEAIATARGQGMPGLEDVAPRIAQLLADDRQPEVVRISAVRALGALDAKQTAGLLLARDQGGVLALALVADPALARWKAAGADELWIARIKDPGASEQLVRSAMGALGVTAPAGAAEPLKGIVGDGQRDMVLRLAAAKALAAYSAAIVVPAAEALATGATVEERLLAVTMLPAGKDERVVKLLDGLARDGEPAVAAIAAEKLLAGAPEALGPLAAKLAENHDVAVRRLAVEALHLHANGENVAVLTRLLNDDAPRVRVAAREALIDCDGRAGLRAAVRQDAVGALQSSGAYGMEQAALILGTLHENSAKDRLVELLNAPQHAVRLAAAVALRRLGLPETFPAQLQRAEAIEQLVRSLRSEPRVGAYEGLDEELSQLLQNLGLGRYGPAEDLMKKLVPKNGGDGEQSRSGAIWSLGFLHETGGDAGLAKSLVGRLMDTNPRDPESPLVRIMSAVSLGRMRDSGAKGALQRFAQEEAGTRVGECCRWALSRIEGKAFVPGPAEPNPVTGWFLEPAE